MLPKNYIKIRGQMISALTASNEIRAVGRWLAAVETHQKIRYVEGAVPYGLQHKLKIVLYKKAAQPINFYEAKISYRQSRYFICASRFHPTERSDFIARSETLRWRSPTAFAEGKYFALRKQNFAHRKVYLASAAADI